MKKTELKIISSNQLVILKRNPQYLTVRQMESLKKSIRRDGFVAPILVRPMKNNQYEVISGNHRFMAAQELGVKNIPCVISNMNAKTAKRLAVNLNTIHGEPNAELLAPFLADMGDDILLDIHLEDDLLKELFNFDTQLKLRLSSLQVPDSIDNESPKSSNKICKCPKCGRKHFEDEKE